MLNLPNRKISLAVSLIAILTIPFAGCRDSNNVGQVDTSNTGNIGPPAKKRPKYNKGTRSIDSSDWELVWSDEFDGEALDLEKWKFQTGASGWGNKEWQNYTKGDNVEVSDGIMKIIARKTGAGQKVGDYTSTRLNSKYSFTYGKVEVRAKMPDLKGNGLWPAIWMLGDSLKTAGWPACGEIDIVEYLSWRHDKVSSALHTKANNHKINTQIETEPIPLETAEEEFHVYGLEWDETQINIFIDDETKPTLTFDRPKDFTDANWPYDKPHHILINLAVGGWGGTKGVDDSIFPSHMEVDYVRVYQPKKN